MPRVLALLFAAIISLVAAADVVGPAGRSAGQVLAVGPGQVLALPSQAARIAGDGAVVEIHPGDYLGDVAVWRQDDLTLRGVGVRPHLRAGGRAAEGKAIWVIKGDRVTVENLELSGARVPSRNGAAIRAEGAGLTIRGCRFHDNEMGVLTNPRPDSVVVIENSEIDHNTTDTDRHGRLGHNLYIHRSRRFILRNCRVHGARTGHQVKSRALRNEIRNNLIRDGDGASSYLLDIAEGGWAVVADNRFEQSAAAANRAAISFAAEAPDPESTRHALRVEDNRFVNHGLPATFVRNHASAPVILKRNRLPFLGVIPLRGR